MPKHSDLHAAFLAHREDASHLDALLTLAITRSKQIARRSLSPEDAEEVAVDSALALHTMLPKLDPMADIQAMLTSITRNKVQDLKRKAKPNVSLEDVEIKEPPSRIPDRKAYQQTLLTAGQAGITDDVIKRMMQGFTLHEISAQDGVPIETLRTRFKRLKFLLKVNQISLA